MKRGKTWKKKRKKNASHVLLKNLKKREREGIQKGVCFPPRYHYTHMHILIRIVWLAFSMDPLFWFGKNMWCKYASLSFPTKLHIKPFVEVRWKEENHALVRNHKHWAIWEWGVWAMFLLWKSIKNPSYSAEGVMMTWIMTVPFLNRPRLHGRHIKVHGCRYGLE